MSLGTELLTLLNPFRRTNKKTYHPHQGCGYTGRKHCLKHGRCTRTRDLSAKNSAAAEYISETFSTVSKDPLQWKERMSHVKDTRH